MAGKKMPWFRMYAEFATDHKVQMMSESYQRRFVMLLCLRCSNGDVTLQDNAVTFMLRISNDEWLETKRVFVENNLIDDDNNIIAWDKRQYQSDSSAERVARFRERQKTASKTDEKCNVTVTPPDTDTDTDICITDVIHKKPSKFDPVGHLVSLGVDKQVATDYCQQRKKKPTLTALQGIAAQAAKANMSIEKALRICCSRGWEGFKAEWVAEKPISVKTAGKFAAAAASYTTIFPQEEVSDGRVIDVTPRLG